MVWDIFRVSDDAAALERHILFTMIVIRIYFFVLLLEWFTHIVDEIVSAHSVLGMHPLQFSCCIILVFPSFICDNILNAMLLFKATPWVSPYNIGRFGQIYNARHISVQ